jgi:spermidine/putrescine transport system substrate-binding protein
LGIGGIFYNDKYYKESEVNAWQQLWDAKFFNQLMLLDDSREVFSMALISEGLFSK